MGKYNSLKEPTDSSIWGVRMTKYFLEVTCEKKVVTFIHGFPACPECNHPLNKDFIESCWKCSKCGTIYTTAELVQAIKNEDTLMKVSVRNLTD